MVVNATKIYQKMKKKCLSLEKNIMKWEKGFIIIIKKYFDFKKFASLEEEV